MSMNEWMRKWFQRPVMIAAPPNVFVPATGNSELDTAINMGAVKLGIIVGHSPSNPGSPLKGNPGANEYSYNKGIAQKMSEYSKKFPKLQVSVILRGEKTVAEAYAEARHLLCDAVIELHFNAFNGLILGSETLSTADLSDVDFAQVIHQRMCMVFDRPGASRGVKAVSKSVMGGENVHSFPGGVNCLVMPFFGDNDVDAKRGVQQADAYAKGLIDAVLLWAKRVDLIRS